MIREALSAMKRTMMVALAILSANLSSRLSFASEEGEVYRAQVMLQAMGFKPGRLDSRFGPHTSAAVRAFQAQEELPISGELDPDTIRRLQTIPDYFRPSKALPESDIQRGKSTASSRRYVIQLCDAALVAEAPERMAAVELLAESRDERAHAALRLILLTDTVAGVRQAAANALGAKGDLGSLNELAFALDYEKEPTVRAEIKREIDRGLGVAARTDASAAEDEEQVPPFPFK